MELAEYDRKTIALEMEATVEYACHSSCRFIIELFILDQVIHNFDNKE
jgi:hypothetical protein